MRRIAAMAYRATLHCGIGNLSATGTCLRADDPQYLPDTFNRVFDSGEPSRICRVMGAPCARSACGSSSGLRADR